MTEYEKLLADILNEEEGDVVPKSRVEAYLLALYEKVGTGSSGGGGGGSGLPTVDITEALMSGDGTIPEEICASLDAYAETKTPIVVQINAEEIAGMGFGCVLDYVNYPVSETVTAQMYVGSITVLEETMNLSIVKGVLSDQWTIIM